MYTLSFYSCLTQSFGLISLSEFPFLVVFSHQFMSNSLWPHGLKHARLPCPPVFPRVCSNLCSLSQWCHPTISSSSALFSCCLQSFPASGSFPTSWLFTSGGQFWSFYFYLYGILLPYWGDFSSYCPVGLMFL